ncbi:putative lysine methyltransferase [Helianthus annuus]|nr:putative lysine methyltransferase [Helianthus annuus]
MEAIKSDGGGSPETPATENMTTISHHYFGDSNGSDDAISITVIESMKEDYGLFVWPCSVILAEYVWQQRSRFQGVSVVEVNFDTKISTF